MQKKRMGNTNVLPNKKNSTKARYVSFSEYGDDWVEVSLPVVTVSESNCSGEHWTKKHKRHKRQKGIVFMMLRRYDNILKIPCVITLTRYAPKKLDRHDNLPMALKWILDAVCAVITGDYRPGRADDSEKIDVIYKQEKCDQYFVKIKIEF